MVLYAASGLPSRGARDCECEGLRGLTGAIDGRRLRVIHGRWARGCYFSRNSEVVTLEISEVVTQFAIPLPSLTPSFSRNPGWGWAVGGDRVIRFFPFPIKYKFIAVHVENECLWASGKRSLASTRCLTQRCCFYVHLPGSHCLLLSVHRCVCVCVCVFALAQVRALVLAVIVDIRKKILRAAAGRPSSPPCSACGF